MPDNVVASGNNIATDEISGNHYQRVKISLGPDGSATDVPIGKQNDSLSIPVAASNEEVSRQTEMLEHLCAAVLALTELAERLDIYSDGNGRLQVALSNTAAQGALSSVGTVTTVTGVTTVSTVSSVTAMTNQANAGNIPCETNTRIVMQNLEQELYSLFPVS